MTAVDGGRVLLGEIADVLGQVQEHATYLAEAHEIEDPLGWMADTAHHTACEICGTSYGDLCPECPGCACYNGRCSGWRHQEWEDQYDNDFDRPCQFCGDEYCDGSGYNCNEDDYNIRDDTWAAS